MKLRCVVCMQKKRLDRERRVNEAAAELQRRLDDRVRRVPLDPIHGSGEGVAVNSELLTPRGSHFRPMHLQVWLRPRNSAWYFRLSHSHSSCNVSSIESYQGMVLPFCGASCCCCDSVADKVCVSR